MCSSLAKIKVIYEINIMHSQQSQGTCRPPSMCVRFNLYLLKNVLFLLSCCDLENIPVQEESGKWWVLGE